MAPAEQNRGKGKEKRRDEFQSAPYKVPDRSQMGENAQAESSQNPEQELLPTGRPETYDTPFLQPEGPQPQSSQPSASQAEASQYLHNAPSHNEDPEAREAQVQKEWNHYFPTEQRKFSSIPPDHQDIILLIGTVGVDLPKKVFMDLCDKNNVPKDERRNKAAYYIQSSIKPAIPLHLRPAKYWGTDQDKKRYRQAVKLYDSVKEESRYGRNSYNREVSIKERQEIAFLQSKGVPEWYTLEKDAEKQEAEKRELEKQELEKSSG
jgi:hypothetical protein